MPKIRKHIASIDKYFNNLQEKELQHTSLQILKNNIHNHLSYNITAMTRYKIFNRINIPQNNVPSHMALQPLPPFPTERIFLFSAFPWRHIFYFRIIQIHIIKLILHLWIRRLEFIKFFGIFAK